MRILIIIAALTLSACSTIEYVPVTPQCTPPPSPALPIIDLGGLWDSLGDSEYRRLEAYIDALWAFLDEQAAMLDALCGE